MKFKLDLYGIMLYLNITDYKKTTAANMYDEWCGTELYICNEENVILNHFSFRDNGLKCESCSRQDKGAIEVSESTAQAIKYIILAPPKKLFSFNISENSIRELQIISNLYLNEKLDKEYKFEKLF